MKQSSVITANGNEATFQNGGESNFLVTGVGTATIASVKFGTERDGASALRLEHARRRAEARRRRGRPHAAERRRTARPGRTTTKLETQVTLKLGQALILSGIKTSTQQRTRRRASRASARSRSSASSSDRTRNEKQDIEGAVFIVPSVVDTVPKSALELINNAMATYKEYSGDIEYVDTYPKTPPNAK